jgi:GT2 family glycosyltransferase
MKLSVIIVNYNVKHFLDQCLHSILLASRQVDMEVFVIDNRSVDGSVEMVQSKYPEVHLIANEENVGFSRANNQGIKASSGEYVLLLNPDTIVEHDTFTKTVAFMESHPDAGGLGVKMVDGNGNFLPESKRGLPTPMVSFYKIFGLSSLFPKSKRFSRYHLGHLDKDQTHQVEVLAGAFMLLRREALKKTGLLDEDFFMYGEDIDLSYRLLKAGYKNYYHPEARIIHYKGESTKKGSINYVFVFYNAMIIFARKHFSKKNANLFSFFINIAIYFRASMAIMSRFWKKAVIPLSDALMLTIGVVVIKNLWESNVIFPEGGHFPTELVTIMLPSYILVWLLSVFLSGGYDRPVYLFKIVRGYFLGTLFILAAYGLLSEEYRFSRAIIVMGAVWGILSSSGIRFIE